MQDAEGKSEQEAFDIIAYKSRDNCRTPMQWNDSPHAGFTTGTPWIDENPNYVEINAASQVDDPDSVFSFYRKLIELRHTMPVIVYGTFTPLLEDPPSIWAYQRELDGCTITFASNWMAEEQPCALWDGKAGEEALICNYPEHTPGILKPYEAYATIRRIP